MLGHDDESAISFNFSPSFIRLLRLLRLLRAVRLVEQFETLYMLVHGLTGSLQVMLWTLLLVGLSIFVFSVIGAEVLARPALIDRPEDYSDLYREIVQKNFFSIQS